MKNKKKNIPIYFLSGFSATKRVKKKKKKVSVVTTVTGPFLFCIRRCLKNLPQNEFSNICSWDITPRAAPTRGGHGLANIGREARGLGRDCVRFVRWDWREWYNWFTFWENFGSTVIFVCFFFFWSRESRDKSVRYAVWCVFVGACVNNCSYSYWDLL